jgi:hypothetical protein
LTHLAKPEEFDAVDQLHRSFRTGEIYCVPGEHDVTENDCRAYSWQLHPRKDPLR